MHVASMPCNDQLGSPILSGCLRSVHRPCLCASFLPGGSQLSMWKTDRYLRPIHVVAYEEQPGCKVGQRRW
jgi:hypothetical protein